MAIRANTPIVTGTADVALVIEVAHTTLERDRGAKKRAYARAGIPVYWIVSLIECVLEVYYEPGVVADEPDYLQCARYSRDQQVPLVVEGREVARISINDLLS